MPYAMIIGLDFKHAIIAVLIGGIGGFLFFFYLSKPVIKALDRTWPYLCSLVPETIKTRYKIFCTRLKIKKRRKIFSRRNRLITKIKRKYGFWGIIFTTPFLLSIPLGAFLVNKYYPRKKHIVIYMIISIVGWAGVLSGIIHLFPRAFF